MLDRSSVRKALHGDEVVEGNEFHTDTSQENLHPPTHTKSIMKGNKHLIEPFEWGVATPLDAKGNP